MAGRNGGYRRRWNYTIVLLALTAILAAVLGWEAWDAGKSHEAVALSSVRGQAVFAAANFAREARGEVLFDLVEDGAEVVEDASGRGGTRRLTEERIRQSVRANRWSEIEHTLLFFRLRLPETDFEWFSPTHRTGPDDLVEWTRVQANALAGHDVSDAHVSFPSGRDEILIYDVSFQGPGEAAVYGAVVEAAAFQDAFDDAFRGERLLPEVLTGDLGNDDVFVARVVGPDGRILYASTPDTSVSTGVVVEHPLSPDFGGMTILLGVRDSAVDRLVSGGLPESRLPFILALLLLTSGLLAAAVWQLRREAELAGLRDDFVSSVSHELRTPLTQIRMFGEMLMLGRVRNDEERSRAVEIIVDESTRLSHQVENVLMFSKGERAPLALNPVETDLTALVEEVVEAFEPLAAAKEASIRTVLEPDVSCVTDRDAARQALLNILDNAVKYGPRGQTVEVGLKQDPRTRRAILWVEDEGPGIPDAQRKRIWDPYVRLDRDRASSVAGSGIGLAVVRQAMEAQGAGVRAESGRRNGGRGARFVIDLPGIDVLPG